MTTIDLRDHLRKLRAMQTETGAMLLLNIIALCLMNRPLTIVTFIVNAVFWFLMFQEVGSDIRALSRRQAADRSDKERKRGGTAPPA